MSILMANIKLSDNSISTYTTIANTKQQCQYGRYVSFVLSFSISLFHLMQTYIAVDTASRSVNINKLKKNATTHIIEIEEKKRIDTRTQKEKRRKELNSESKYAEYPHPYASDRLNGQTETAWSLINTKHDKLTFITASLESERK